MTGRAVELRLQKHSKFVLCMAFAAGAGGADAGHAFHDRQLRRHPVAPGGVGGQAGGGAAGGAVPIGALGSAGQPLNPNEGNSTPRRCGPGLTWRPEDVATAAAGGAARVRAIGSTRNGAAATGAAAAVPFCGCGASGGAFALGALGVAVNKQNQTKKKLRALRAVPSISIPSAQRRAKVLAGALLQCCVAAKRRCRRCSACPWRGGEHIRRPV